VFHSFFLAGFECATGRNLHGEWIDQVCATQHDQFAAEDYRLIRRTGMRAARDGVRWPCVERAPGRFDFSTLHPLLEAARAAEVEVIWDLFHYGYPEGLDLFSDEFPRRFADYCYAAGRYIAARTEGTCYFTPVNEPSYFAWAAGEAALFAPHTRGRAYELKVNLIRAAIQGIDALRAAAGGCRIVNADPVCRVVAPRDRPDLEEAADHFNRSVVWESWDMLAGLRLPELGGARHYLDIPGINYYWTNQWELTREGVPLADDDPRRLPFRQLLRIVWDRYGGDLIVTETSHRDDMRPVWLRELADECEAAIEDGIPLRGVCLYPVLGMPEWHAQHEWTRMGLWDLIPQSPTLGRIPHDATLEAFREIQRLEGCQFLNCRDRTLAAA
jgi:beta-glucosidase/6-phospho-beta-glucosidase/beta-galactosidase